MAALTARDLLTRALRRMGVLSEYEDMTADQGARGLEDLDDMLAGFNAEGINYAHTELTSLDDAINMPDELKRSVRLMLIRDLADGYGFMITPQMGLQIGDAKNSLQAFYHVTPKALTDRILRRRRSYNINRDA